jgi:branched-chain amino acid transport system ATP-binding protein
MSRQQGLNPRESTELNELLQNIRKDHGTSILLIEHDMGVVMQISDHVVVLDYGEKISDGSAEMVKNDPKVISAYLGVDEDEVAAIEEIAEDLPELVAKAKKAGDPGKAAKVAKTVKPAKADKPAGAEPAVSEIVVENAGSHPGAQPAGIKAARGGTPDKLTRVKGIGPVNETKLNALGIWAFRPDRGLEKEGSRMGRQLPGFPGAHRTGGLGEAGQGIGARRRREAGETRQGRQGMSDQPLLSIRGVETYYGKIVALRGVDVEVNKGEIVTLIGANGAGKSTLMMTICGSPRARNGQIIFNGEDITRTPTHEIIRMGIAQSPEGRRIFARMTVMENLQMGAQLVSEEHFDTDLKRVFELFPRLKERASQRGGTLSGGEQQMLAIARALMSRPTLLLLDEPSLGLAPLIVKQIFEIIKELNTNQGLTVFLVEQNAFHALKLAHRGYVMVNGNITMSGTGAELLKRDEVRAAYLEGGAH